MAGICRHHWLRMVWVGRLLRQLVDGGSQNPFELADFLVELSVLLVEPLLLRLLRWSEACAVPMAAGAGAAAALQAGKRV